MSERVERQVGDERVLLLREEQAVVGSEWVPVTRARVTRRIVTDVQTVEVRVRREELIITEETLAEDAATPLPGGRAPATPEPLVFVLSAEVPVVTVTVVPLERVTLTPTLVTGERTVSVDLQAEHVRLVSNGT